ncbi:MAG: 1-deoxy-D-xylulose-5-phosphate reductoisomerase [Planctomycetales bacterium]|nr:1-deoxy-D-xylulose-5-phosphate reductoisomerase [Planctomycetales bacterium]
MVNQKHSNPKPKTSIAILGATGSIGTATLSVLSSLGKPWRLIGASAHSKVVELTEIANRHEPHMVVVTSEQCFSRPNLPPGCQFLCGPEHLQTLAEHPEVDTVVAAVVGSAGLHSALCAARAGKRLALANKEALVVAGNLMKEALLAGSGELIPVDSEHSAIFQAIKTGQPREIRRIILTASGGPFRTWTNRQLSEATITDALAHPTWQMGRKITIDSATMMNKALEIIEAKWLFDLPVDKIQVVIHPQSIIHSMVEFSDGSVIAQLSPPDMRLPIQYALTYPQRIVSPYPKLDWTESLNLELIAVDLDRFPAIQLGWEVCSKAGTCGAVVNAANEAAVELFLAGKLRFLQIVEVCQRILEQHNFDPSPDLPYLMELDRWARNETRKWASLN